MSKMGKIKQMILDILSDGKSHEVKEFSQVALDKGYIQDPLDTAVRNSLHQLINKNSNIQRLKKGVYIMTSKSYYYQNEEGLAQSLNYISKTIEEITTFNWMTCTDTEIAQARKASASLTDLLSKLKTAF